MEWIRYGPHALLFRFADRVGLEAFSRCRALVGELERQPTPGLIEFVPAFTTLLLEFDSGAGSLEGIGAELATRFDRAATTASPEGPIKEIPVIYDGPDLSTLAHSKGLSIEEVSALHRSPVYTVYMLGFAPGFPYLGDLDPRLHAARLVSPRRRVPGGSVAIGGEHTGIYPVDSPGGWHIIGRTTIRIFDPARGAPAGPDERMFHLHPGDRVRFVCGD
jgi:inhibitor of KinA